MKRSFLISPAYNLIEFVGDILLTNPQDLSKNLIVFPGKRPGHFLRKYIADKLKMPFATPLILSIDEFIDYVYYKMLRFNDRGIEPIDGVPIIFQLNTTERLIADKEVPLSLDEFLPWGFKLFSDFEELYIEDVSPLKLKEVETIVDEELPTKVREKILTLSNLYKLFYEKISSLNLSTRSLRYQKVALNIKNADFEIFNQILFVGFFVLTNSERKIVSYLTQHDNVILIFQKGEGIEQTIKSLNIEVEKKEAEVKLPEIKFYQATDAHGEIFKLNHLISERKKFDHKDVIVLPLPDTLFPIVQHTLGFTVDGFNISMGYPLSHTPVYALIQILGRLLETRKGDEYYMPDYLNFVLHPYMKNIYFNRASYATRIIFHTIEEYITDQQKRFVTLKEIEENNDIIKVCIKKLQKHEGLQIDQEKIKNHLHSIHETLIKQFENIKNIEDFGDKLLFFFSFLSENSPVNLHPYTVPFIKTMLEAIYELKTSGLKNEAFVRIGSYFRFLKNYMRSVSYPFSGTPVKGLQVLGLLETRNIKFDIIYLLDANEGVIPHTTKEDTMLPYGIRKHLGLPTHEDREKISNYYFETLLSGSKEAYIFYIEGADKEKSRFIEKLIWQFQKRNKLLDSSSYDVFFTVSFKQPETKPVKKNHGIMEYIIKNVSFTPSKLDVYLRCPLQFYYKNILCLKEKEEISDDIDPRARGDIVHRILMRFFINKVGKKLTITNEDYKSIEQIVEEEFEKSYPNSDGGPIYLMKSQIKIRMQDVLDFHQNECDDIIILECENESRPGFIPKYPKPYMMQIIVKPGHRVFISGRLDRIDKRTDGIYIVDYKTSAQEGLPDPKNFNLSNRNDWHKTLKSIQLPLYILLYLQKNEQYEMKDTNSCLMLLGSTRIKEKKLFNKKNHNEEVFEIYKQAIVTLIEEILNPKIDFLPTSGPEENCPDCEFKIICGRQWMIKKW